MYSAVAERRWGWRGWGRGWGGGGGVGGFKWVAIYVDVAQLGIFSVMLGFRVSVS